MIAPLVGTVRAALFFGLLAGLPVHAQTVVEQGEGPSPGAVGGPVTEPAPVAAPASRPSEAQADQGPPDKVPDRALPDRTPGEPDAARFGAAGPSRPGVDPARLCAALSPGASAPPAWQRSALPDESWECFAERKFKPEDGGGSVFAILRGRTKAGVDGLRLKLNLPGEGAGQAALEAAGETLKAVFASLGRMLPPALATALAGRAPFSQEIGGMAMQVRQEFGDVPRYNVTIDFAPSPKAVGKARGPRQTGGPDQP